VTARAFLFPQLHLAINTDPSGLPVWRSRNPGNQQRSGKLSLAGNDQQGLLMPETIYGRLIARDSGRILDQRHPSAAQ
jgi:hypothetical protein